MSKSNIYETKWTDLVFENKNKEYGAYQLRQESSKTSVTALFLGVLLVTGLGSASMLLNKFKAENVPGITLAPTDPLVLVNLDHIVEPKKQDPILPPSRVETAAPASTSVQLTNPVVAKTADATTSVIATNKDNTPTTNNPEGTGDNLNAPPQVSGGAENILPVDKPTNPGPYSPTVLDKMPEFPGGMTKFYTYVGNNFARPELDAEKILKVYVSFVIEKDGSITDIKVVNDPGYGMGKEAIRVLKSLRTKWIPGVLNGQPVRTAYNLPITVKTELE